MKFLRNRENAVTPYKIDKFGGTNEHRVGTNAEDTPYNVSSKLVDLPGRFAVLV